MNTYNKTNVLKIARYECLTSSLFFTAYFFKQRNKSKFIVNDHHRLICEKLDRVYKGEIKRLIINIAPRYSKTELAVKTFIANGFALNPSCKFIHLSYADDLALDNSEAVRDLVQSEEYQQLFPDVQIKPSSKAKDKWYTTKGGGVLARSAGGQVTGFGAGKVESIDENVKLNEFLADIDRKRDFSGAIIIDDPIKPEDAESEVIRERINSRFDSTIRSRVNSRNTPIIIIMQRLHEQDLCGYLLEQDPDEWEVLSLPCIQEDERGNEFALWPHKHTLNELKRLEELDVIMFNRQYQQEPMPREGFLYSPFRTYRELPLYQNSFRKAYIDTADEGSDFLCSIVYVEMEHAAYVIDVLYTDERMETSEPLTAKQLSNHKVELVKIESNNGGKGFAREVERQTRVLENYLTEFVPFHQTGNKVTRIITNQAKVNNLIYMPEGWDTRWPKFFKAVSQYKAQGKNKHDDAPDVLTGIVEDFGMNSRSNNLDLLSNLL
jgi:predicted phage terminase large subunit-like protein